MCFAVRVDSCIALGIKRAVIFFSMDIISYTGIISYKFVSRWLNFLNVTAHVRDPPEDIRMKTYVVFRYIHTALNENFLLQRATIV